MNEGVGKQLPEIKVNETKPYRGIKGLKRMGRIIQMALFIRKHSKNPQASFKQVDKFTSSLIKQGFRNLSDNDLNNATAAIITAWHEYKPVYMACTMSGVTNMPLLVKTLDKYFPGRGEVLANALMLGQGDITSAEQGYRLLELAESARGDSAARDYLGRSDFDSYAWEKELPEESLFKQLFRSFLAQYGHRGVYEMDICNPRWQEDPSYPLQVIKSTMATANPQELKEQQKAKNQAAWRKIEQGIPKYRHNKIRKQVEKVVKGAALREMAKYELLKLYQAWRMVFLEIGIRLEDRGILAEKADVFHCSWAELFSILKEDWNDHGLKLLVEERKEWMEKMEELSPPDYYIDETSHFAEAILPGTDPFLQGLGVSAGKASGPAKLLRHPDQEKKLNPGDVLVAPSTDPGWTPLFLRASAIIIESSSGAASHGAIVAREFGIPAVLNIPGVMHLIKDEQNVVVDGDEGKVYIQ